MLPELSLRSSLVCYFSFAKRLEYYWLMALIPFLISCAKRVSRLTSDVFMEDYPRSYLAVGFSSLTSGFIGWLSVISINA